jgi:hypothetical protein
MEQGRTFGSNRAEKRRSPRITDIGDWKLIPGKKRPIPSTPIPRALARGTLAVSPSDEAER